MRRRVRRVLLLALLLLRRDRAPRGTRRVRDRDLSQQRGAPRQARYELGENLHGYSDDVLMCHIRTGRLNHDT